MFRRERFLGSFLILRFDSYFPALEPCLFVTFVFHVPGNIKDSLSESKDKLWSPFFHYFTVECFFGDFTVKNDYFFRPYDAFFPVSLFEICVIFLNSVSQLDHLNSLERKLCLALTCWAQLRAKKSEISFISLNYGKSRLVIIDSSNDGLLYMRWICTAIDKLSCAPEGYISKNSLVSTSCFIFHKIRLDLKENHTFSLFFLI